jgi:hypothetical protein
MLAAHPKTHGNEQMLKRFCRIKHYLLDEFSRDPISAGSRECCKPAFEQAHALAKTAQFITQ